MVVLAQRELAEGLTHDPVAASLVAEQVAPPAGAFLAVSGNTDRDRSCACYAGDPLGETAGREHESSVIDDDDPSLPGEGGQQFDVEGVGLGSPSSCGTHAHCIQTCASPEGKLAEKGPDRDAGAIAPCRRQARAWAVGFCNNLPVPYQPCPAMGAADIEAQDSRHGVGAGSVAPSELRTVRSPRELSKPVGS